MKFNKFLFLSLIFLTSSCRFFEQNHIQTVESYNEVKNVLDQCDQNSLVVFDVDDTLIIPEDKILKSVNMKSNFFNELKNKLSKKYKNTNFELVESKVNLQAKQKLIEANIVKIINDLLAKNIKVIAFTFMRSGKFGIIPSLQDWRYDHLKEFGLKFSNDFNFEEKFFTNLPKKLDSYPMFYKGILISNLTDKGETLSEFLKALNWKPTKIIFFDDNFENIQSVETALQKFKIPYYGYHYLGAKKILEKNKIQMSIDKKVAEHQLDYLMQNEKWLNDNECKKLLNS